MVDNSFLNAANLFSVKNEPFLEIPDRDLISKKAFIAVPTECVTRHRFAGRGPVTLSLIPLVLYMTRLMSGPSLKRSIIALLAVLLLFAG